MRATIVHGMILFFRRSGTAFASHRGALLDGIGVRSIPVGIGGGIGGIRRRRHRPSSTTTTLPLAFLVAPGGGGATRPNRATASLAASLRDILERGGSTAPNVPTPAAAASPAAPAGSTTTGDGGRGGMMKGPLGAAPLSTTVGGRTITIASSDSLSSGGAAGADPIQPIVSISDSYDSGNGELASLRIVDGLDDDCDVHVRVRIRPDPYTALEGKRHFQHFSFRATLNPDSPAMRGLFRGRDSIRVKYVLDNAGDASYADAFDGYKPFVARGPSPNDPDAWERVRDASYKGGRLAWTHVHRLAGDRGAAAAHFAYFPPYSQERRLGLLARCAEAEGAAVKSLGQSLEGREIDYVAVGTGPLACWIVHRQHPGESMAEFYAEGLLGRLLGLDGEGPDDVAREARELFTFRVVPNINPDGSIRGYLRTNAAGQNLNREWCPSPAPPPTDGADGADNGAAATYDAPTPGRSPEVLRLLRAMDRTGCDAFLDVHGDEALPFNFLAGSEGMPVWGRRLEALHGAFLASYERANGDMQAKVSYDPDEPGEGMPNICSNQIAQRFDCFSATLEMPFKELLSDATKKADGDDGDGIGWGPGRARRLGASALDALVRVAPLLRDGGEFWEDLPGGDAYVRPSSEY